MFTIHGLITPLTMYQSIVYPVRFHKHPAFVGTTVEMAIMYNVRRRPKLYITAYIRHQNGPIFQEKRAYIYLELKNISRVVCFALSLLIFCRWPRSRRPASMKSSAPSVPTRRQSSSSFRHASIIPLGDGGTTSGSSSSDVTAYGLPSPGAP